MGLFGKFDFGSILTPCILEKVTARQNHLHITFTDFDKEYKEESIHQNCKKQKNIRKTDFLYACFKLRHIC
jgi:hypothetical protein